MPQPRSATRTRPPTNDPLADLRPADDTPAGHTPNTPAEPEGTDALRPVASQDFHDQAKAEIVAAFHLDQVATGMLHKGGTCGCRYLADLALRTALGAPQEPVQAEEDPEDPQGAQDG